MENREAAIEWFSMLKEKFVKTEYEGYLDLAISALEKQIPKRKLEKDPDNENLFTLRCPTCGALIGNYNKRLDRFSYMVKKTIVTSAGKRLILANQRRNRMDNKEAIQYIIGHCLGPDADRDGTAWNDAMMTAIEALEQQGKAEDEWCTDCKEYDKDRHCCPRFSKVIRGALDEVEQQRWISVSEALPEDYTDVLVWFEYYRYGDYNCMYQTYGIGNYSAKYDSWTVNHETGWHKLRVVAWRPFPEPYQEDEA